MSEDSTAAKEAIRIAETYLRGHSIERRKALATEIVQAINRCEAELGLEVAKMIDQLSDT